jgi:hypothetical protein
MNQKYYNKDWQEQEEPEVAPKEEEPEEPEEEIK